ncbi:DUF397 domain-containing protein [Streptomyces olivoreticuli]
MSTYDWQKSSFSGDSSNCLNIAAASDGALRLRESDDPASVLAPTSAKLGALIMALKGNHLTRERCP